MGRSTVIDQEHLARQTAGDIDLQHELLTLFLTQLTELRSTLAVWQTTAGSTSPANLPSVLHRIRGAAATVGAQHLVASLSEAEEGLQRDVPPRAVLDPLGKELDLACATLADLIAARVPAGLAKGGESR